MDEELKTYLDGKFAALESKLLESIHDSETRLLSEFWKWGRVTDQRIRRVEASDATTAEGWRQWNSGYLRWSEK